MQEYIFKKIKQISIRGWILIAIILLGIFLRAYNFHAWTDFGSDQVKDINIVNSVVVNHAPWPSYGPDMSHSGAGGHSQRFLLGPMYYYFEIIAAKIFGNYPDKLVYPDLLFSILSIPLLYYFFKRYFSPNLSLALTGLYAISFYALSFSHSAWNVNSIPFFSLLFLLGLYELILAKEKAAWSWIIALGVSLGVSVQLHAILLILFPATLFFASIIYLRKNPRVWKKLAIVFVIAIFLNLGQIIAEQKNGFLNSKIFFISIASPSNNTNNSFIKFADDVNCTVHGNAYILSSIGLGSCDHSIVKAIKRFKVLDVFYDISFIVKIILSLAFSGVGYYLLVRAFRKENDDKKRTFLGLLGLYIILSFFVLLPLDVTLLRYFVHTFFLPLMFLGFAVEYLIAKKTKRISTSIIAVMFLLVMLFNFLSIMTMANTYSHQNRTDLDYIILGELEATLDFMQSFSAQKNKIYVSCEKDQAIFLRSLLVIANAKNIEIVRLYPDDVWPNDVPIFNIRTRLDGEVGTQEHINVGKVGILKIR